MIVTAANAGKFGARADAERAVRNW